MTLGLSATQLAKMRAQVLELCPDTGTIYSPSYAADAMGAIGNPTYTAVASGTVYCRLDPLGNTSDNLAQTDLRETLDKRYRLTCPYDAPLAKDYQLTVNGQTYQIVQLDIDHSWNVSRRAIVVEVE